jgi:tetratricopeptide (TPR) repeat protein
MTSKIIRISIILIAIILIITFIVQGFWWGVLGVLLSLIIYFWSQFRAARVYIAWLHVSRQNFDKAEKSLAKIKNPDKLTGTNKSYFHLTKGVLALSKQKLELAERELKASLKAGLKTENDQAIVYLQLSGIELSKRNKKKAEEYLSKCKSLKHHKALDAEIIKLEAMFKQANQMQRQQFPHTGKRNSRGF